jgi:hypothetical protein
MCFPMARLMCLLGGTLRHPGVHTDPPLSWLLNDPILTNSLQGWTRVARSSVRWTDEVRIGIEACFTQPVDDDRLRDLLGLPHGGEHYTLDSEKLRARDR